MIVHTFDYGWGPELEIKQLEKEILDQYLQPFCTDDISTVVINNTWYDEGCHTKTIESLKSINPNRLVLVSMIDAPSTWPRKFSDIDCDIRCVGYYSGNNEIDFWAVAVDRWFQRPGQDLFDPLILDTAYMCLNRKPHWHRQRLYDQLVNSNLVDRGIVSMGSKTIGQPAQRLLLQDGQFDVKNLAPNAGIEQTGIINDIMTLGHIDNWRRTFLNVVTETQFDIVKTGFVSEKIYKPIIGCRPFLVYAADGAVTWLRHKGFEPYVDDFLDITDLDLSRPENTIPFLQILCDQPRSYWQHRLVALRGKILYNKNRFDLYVAEIYSKIKEGIQCQI